MKWIHRRISWLLALLMGVAVAGCGLVKTELDKCYEQREYQAARPAPRLRVPDDLQPLAPEAWVAVPYGEANSVPTPRDQPCLIEAPDFRDTRSN